ncbi:MAG: hypothetical protein U5K77_02900 [Candidatus Saccharibacteria bacterium]|nr:hypothetical protein [Candidatus Saccharibacteria bacterium]
MTEHELQSQELQEHQDAQETTQQHGFIDKVKSSFNTKKAAVILAAGLTAGGAHAAYDTEPVGNVIDDAIETVDSFSIPLTLDVDPELPGTMVDINEGLRDVATPYFIGAAGLTLALVGYARMSERGAAMQTISQSNSSGNAKRLLLPALLMASVGTGSSLASDSAEAAVRPVKAIEQNIESNLGTDVSDMYMPFVQHERQVINNHGGISETAVDDLVEKHGSSNVVPLRVALGSIRPLNGGVEPPSAAIVTAPSEIISQIGSLETTGDLPGVIVGEQLRANIGDIVEVDGKNFEVTDISSEPGGIGRVTVYGSNEDLEGIFPEETYSAVLVNNNISDEVSNEFEENNIQHSETTLEDLYDEYERFFLGTISSSQMDNLLKLSLVAAAGVTYAAVNRGGQNRNRDASLYFQGTSLNSLNTSILYTTYADSIKAAALAAPLGIVMKAMTARAQFGFELDASPKDLGTGLLVGQIVMFAGFMAGERRQTHKNVKADNLRVQV